MNWTIDFDRGSPVAMTPGAIAFAMHEIVFHGERVKATAIDVLVEPNVICSNIVGLDDPPSWPNCSRIVCASKPPYNRRKK